MARKGNKKKTQQRKKLSYGKRYRLELEKERRKEQALKQKEAALNPQLKKEEKKEEHVVATAIKEKMKPKDETPKPKDETSKETSKPKQEVEEQEHRFGSDNQLVGAETTEEETTKEKVVVDSLDITVEPLDSDDKDLSLLDENDKLVTSEVDFDAQIDIDAIASVGVEDFYRFRAHVGWLINGGADDEFRHLFESTQADFTADRCSTALTATNREKNRYANVLPYDFNRVRMGQSRFIDQPNNQLPSLQGDYINGSYLLGDFTPGTEESVGVRAMQSCPYIAAQGPKENTVVDFWRVTWEQNIHCVVMLGKPIENNMLKFSHYWPDESILTAGPFQIKPVRTVDHQEYLKRIYIITKTEEPRESRVIIHFLFTHFPDHGIPATTSGFLHLIEMAELETRQRHALSPRAQETPPPIIVHCSAGLGRTGVYCTIAMTLRKMAAARRDAFSIMDTMLALRRQRAGMMQTRDQLLFCYLTILDRATPLFTNTQTEGTSYFHANCDSKLAEMVLSKCSPGACLFRPSSATGFVSLSLTQKANEDDDSGDVSILHTRVQVQDNGFLLEGSQVLYLSLDELLVGEEYLTDPIDVDKFKLLAESCEKLDN